MREDDGDRGMFADPGGRSALRKASKSNPRNRPCPTCGRPNALTPADVAKGYQCDRCADAEEGPLGGGGYGGYGEAKPMNRSLASIKFLRQTGNLDEAVGIALGKKPIPKRLKEDAGEQGQRSQTWFLPDQDSLNRFCLYLENQLGLECSIQETDNGTQGGYQVKVSGNFSEEDIANVAGSLRATRLDQMAGQT